MVGVYSPEQLNALDQSHGWVTQGVRVGFDFGSVRIGVAASDQTGVLATPHASLETENPNLWGEITELVTQVNPVVFYVGEPISLAGGPTASSKDATKWAGELAQHVPGIPVRMLDERLTSSMAEAQMKSGGQKPSKAKAKIDPNAAAVLLQGALEFERRHQRWAGKPLADG